MPKRLTTPKCDKWRSRVTGNTAGMAMTTMARVGEMEGNT